MRNWPQVLTDVLTSEKAVALLTIVKTRGSTPRDIGTRMVVLPSNTIGTIGGGTFEFEATSKARETLNACQTKSWLQTYSLGPLLDQCCGGQVDILFEVFTRKDISHLAKLATAKEETHLKSYFVTRLEANQTTHTVVEDPKGLTSQLSNSNHSMTNDSTAIEGWVDNNTLQETPIGAPLSGYFVERTQCKDPRYAIYGAGPVGKALVNALLPFEPNIIWIDSREGFLSKASPGSLSTLWTDDPVETVLHMNNLTNFLVMTHSHPLDYLLVRTILEHHNFGFCGLIGSETKAARFRARLRDDGLDQSQIAKLHSPIGLSAIPGKEPAAIAVSITGHLLAEGLLGGP